MSNKIKTEIPGSYLVEGREFLYVSDDGNDQFEEDLFEKVTNIVKEPIAQTGGVISENCKLWIPTGELFHGLSYKGDIDGWRKEITLGAKVLGLLTGYINENNINLSDGRIYSLCECRVKFID